MCQKIIPFALVGYQTDDNNKLGLARRSLFITFYYISQLVRSTDLELG